MTACVFCAIVEGRAPAHVVWRTPEAVAFLDRRPLFAGHTLVVPPAHHETLTDLPTTEVGGFFARVRVVAGAVEEACGAEGSFVAMNNRVSQSVPHLHVHVVPRRRGDGLRGFFWPRTRYGEGEADEVAGRISAALGTVAELPGVS
ncbi:MAG: HIT family protein [Actinomyces sp.]|nr:MAG: HIT family protein [Actinomyces sp.]